MKYTVVEFTAGNYQKWETQLTSEYKTYVNKEAILFNNSHPNSTILELDDTKINLKSILKKSNIRTYLILSGTELLGFAIFTIDVGGESHNPLITLHHFHLKQNTLEAEEEVQCIKRIVNKVKSSWGDFNIDFRISVFNSHTIHRFIESGFIRNELILTI